MQFAFAIRALLRLCYMCNNNMYTLLYDILLYVRTMCGMYYRINIRIRTQAGTGC
jgi:hypothetical protein